MGVNPKYIVTVLHLVFTSRHSSCCTDKHNRYTVARPQPQSKILKPLYHWVFLLFFVPRLIRDRRQRSHFCEQYKIEFCKLSLFFLVKCTLNSQINTDNMSCEARPRSLYHCRISTVARHPHRVAHR